MLANGWPAAGPKHAAVTHWGGDHASRVLPFAAGCGFEAYPDEDASWDTREESILERRSRLNAARQTRLSDLCAAITPDKDDSLEARQRRLFQLDVKSKTREERPPPRAIYGPALLDVSDRRSGGSSPQDPVQRRLRRDHALEYPLRVDLPPPDDRISVII